MSNDVFPVNATRLDVGSHRHRSRVRGPNSEGGSAAAAIATEAIARPSHMRLLPLYAHLKNVHARPRDNMAVAGKAVEQASCCRRAVEVVRPKALLLPSQSHVRSVGRSRAELQVSLRGGSWTSRSCARSSKSTGPLPKSLPESADGFGMLRILESVIEVIYDCYTAQTRITITTLARNGSSTARRGTAGTAR